MKSSPARRQARGQPAVADLACPARDRAPGLRPAGRLLRPPRPAIPHTSGYRLRSDGPHQNRPPGEGRRLRAAGRTSRHC